MRKFIQQKNGIFKNYYLMQENLQILQGNTGKCKKTCKMKNVENYVENVDNF